MGKDCSAGSDERAAVAAAEAVFPGSKWVDLREAVEGCAAGLLKFYDSCEAVEFCVARR